jgi:DNA processing protein
MISPAARDLLRLTLVPGVGPVLTRRLLDRFTKIEGILAASPAQLQEVQGIGARLGPSIARDLRTTGAALEDELALAEKLGVSILGISDPGYPELLRQIPDAPPILYIRGTLETAERDRFTVGIVGSRDATAYGIEQGERFAGGLARAGLTIVSGGARGIDTAAHRGAWRAGGRTIVVLGCGLAECYPPENAELFARIAEGRDGAGGAIISELPLRTLPTPDNFPARNRLISGLSLGIIVIEAGARSGSLITARLATEEHGREVMAVPGRVDSSASSGTLQLLKQGGAALVTDPGDVLDILRGPARHAFDGTHAVRYANPAESPPSDSRNAPTALFDAPGMSSTQRQIVQALDRSRTIDEIALSTGLDAARLRSELTGLELSRRVKRIGSRFERA